MLANLTKKGLGIQWRIQTLSLEGGGVVVLFRLPCRLCSFFNFFVFYPNQKGASGPLIRHWYLATQIQQIWKNFSITFQDYQKNIAQQNSGKL